MNVPPVAGRLVRFAPLTAGSGEGNLASGSVPEFKFEAAPAVKPPDVPVVFWLRVATLAAAIVPEEIFEAFNDVKLAPEPLKVVATHVPDIVAPELDVSIRVVFACFKVIPPFASIANAVTEPSSDWNVTSLHLKNMFPSPV